MGLSCRRIWQSSFVPSLPRGRVSGGWWAAAFLAGVLAASGVAGLLPLVAPAVLPLLFDVHQMRLTRSRELVLAELQLTPEARSGGLTAEELYAKLPYQIRDQLSWLDFVDFLDQGRPRRL